MTTPTGNEKRKHPRVGFKTPMKIHVEVDGKQILLDGDSSDLSLKGVFISARVDELPVDALCRIKIYLTGGVDEIALPITGRVVRHDEDGAGIVFDTMDVDTYAHLKNIVYYNSDDDSV